MLRGNQSVLHKSPVRYLGGTATAGAYAASVRTNFTKQRLNLSPFIFTERNSIPEGYNIVGAITPSIADGNLSALTTIEGSGELTATAILAKLAEATLSGSGDLTASLGVVTQGEATLSGSGSLSADALAVSSVEATLSGSGSISASLSAILPIEAALSGSGTISPVLTGIGRLEAAISPFTDLSPEGLAQALLDNNEIEDNYSVRETLRLVAAVLAGKVSGSPTTTITFRDLNDTKDRVVATVDGDGNRTALTLDVSD